MNILSTFDGISAGQQALKEAGISVEKYFASEINKYSISTTLKNFPDTIIIGDVQDVKYIDGVLKTQNGGFDTKIDMLIGGSPCTGFSKAGKGMNFNDPRSKLFFEFVSLLDEIKPKYFLLENVNMKKNGLTSYHSI